MAAQGLKGFPGERKKASYPRACIAGFGSEKKKAEKQERRLKEMSARRKLGNGLRATFGSTTDKSWGALAKRLEQLSGLGGSGGKTKKGRIAEVESPGGEGCAGRNPMGTPAKANGIRMRIPSQRRGRPTVFFALRVPERKPWKVARRPKQEGEKEAHGTSNRCLRICSSVKGRVRVNSWGGTTRWSK